MAKKKLGQIFKIYEEIQRGLGARSNMRIFLLRMRKSFVEYDFAIGFFLYFLTV
jgi:hypothetical protein